jgi:Protein of unknown function (DUF1565)
MKMKTLLQSSPGKLSQHGQKTDILTVNERRSNSMTDLLRRLLPHIVSVVFLMFVMQGNTSAADYFVSSNGSDTNAGTKVAPWKTIQHAATIVKPGDRCLIRAGTYRETITPTNSGKDKAPIIFEAFEDEKVVVSGADVIQGPWKNYKADTIVADMPWTLGPGKDMVFVDGKVVIQGRHPNTHTSEHKPPGIDLPPLWMTYGDFRVTYGSPDLSNPSDLNQEAKDHWKGAIYAGLHHHAWAMQTATVQSSAKGVVTVKDQTKNWWFPDFLNLRDEKKKNEHADYNQGYLTHHLNTIDIPGEWHQQDSKLYLIPPKDTSVPKSLVEAKRRHLAFNLRDRNHIVLKGLRIFAASVTMDNANDCVIDGCRMSFISHFTKFEDARDGYFDGTEGYTRPINGKFNQDPGQPQRGEVGVYVGGKNNVIKNSVIKYSAGAGLFMTGHSTTVTNNIIHDCGYAGTYAGCIYISFVPKAGGQDQTGVRGGHTITYNDIYNSGRALILVLCQEGGPKWPSPTTYDPMDIGFNRLHNASVTARDNGSIYAFYINSGTNEKRTLIHHNLIWDHFADHMGYLIYMDYGVENMDINTNILWQSSRSRRVSNFIQVLGPANGRTQLSNNTILPGTFDGGPEGIPESNYPGGKHFRTGPTVKDEIDSW